MFPMQVYELHVKFTSPFYHEARKLLVSLQNIRFSDKKYSLFVCLQSYKMIQKKMVSKEKWEI